MPFNAFIFLVTGGALYTLGTLFYVRDSMPYHHSIWHLFVLGGSIFHFFSIMNLPL
jgi:hemolysin III